MKDEVDARAGPPAGVRVANVFLEPLEASGARRPDRVHVLALPRGEIVEDSHVVPVPEQALGDVGADESGPPVTR